MPTHKQQSTLDKCLLPFCPPGLSCRCLLALPSFLPIECGNRLPTQADSPSHLQLGRSGSTKHSRNTQHTIVYLSLWPLHRLPQPLPAPPTMQEWLLHTQLHKPSLGTCFLQLLHPPGPTTGPAPESTRHSSPWRLLADLERAFSGLPQHTLRCLTHAHLPAQRIIPTCHSWGVNRLFLNHSPL